MQDTSPEGAVDKEQSPPTPPKDSLAVGMVRLSHILPGLSHNQALPNVAAHTENEKEAFNMKQMRCIFLRTHQKGQRYEARLRPPDPRRGSPRTHQLMPAVRT